MPEYLLDLTATCTARLTADDLNSAVRAVHDVLNCLDPGIVITGDGNVSGAVTEISLGLVSEDQATLSVAEVDGEAVTSGTELDGMITPVVCDRLGEDPDCEQVYDEAGGDGYCGLCPHCADVTEPD